MKKDRIKTGPKNSEIIEKTKRKLLLKPEEDIRKKTKSNTYTNAHIHKNMDGHINKTEIKRQKSKTINKVYCLIKYAFEKRTPFDTEGFAPRNDRSDRTGKYMGSIHEEFSYKLLKKFCFKK